MTAGELRKEAHGDSAMELSRARLEAQSAASPSDHRMTYRESLRNHRGLMVPQGTPPRPNRRGGPGGSKKVLLDDKVGEKKADDGGRECPESPSKRLRSDASASDARDVRRIAEPHSAYRNVDQPIWRDGDSANPELNSTYKFPRLCLRDPVDVIESGGGTDLDTESGAWWFDLQRRVVTTLPHARDGQVADLLRKRAALHLPPGGTVTGSAGDHSVSTSGVACHAAMRNLCFDFDPKDTPVNCWSEPAASTLKVRGSNYGRDGVKVESDSAFFRVLGVDSFGGGAAGEEEGRRCTDGFLRRWRAACDEVGLERPPFL